MNEKDVKLTLTDEEFQKCLKYWIDKLQLFDWNIKAELVDDIKTDLCATSVNHICFVNKTSNIKVSKVNIFENQIEKYVHELELVHELLHCRMNFLNLKLDTIEMVLYETFEHQTLQSLAKSFFFMKYNVNNTFFLKDDI